MKVIYRINNFGGQNIFEGLALNSLPMIEPHTVVLLNSNNTVIII